MKISITKDGEWILEVYTTSINLGNGLKFYDKYLRKSGALKHDIATIHGNKAVARIVCKKLQITRANARTFRLNNDIAAHQN